MRWILISASSQTPPKPARRQAVEKKPSLPCPRDIHRRAPHERLYPALTGDWAMQDSMFKS